MSVSAPLDRAIEALRSDPLLSAALLFGSAATGQMRDDSDVDFAVLHTDDRSRREADVDLVARLGRLGALAGRDVHLIDLEAASVELRRAVFGRGVRLFDRSAGRLADLERRTMVEYVDGEYLRRVVDRYLAAALQRSHG